MINVEQIGAWAGLVWKALDTEGTLGVKRIKKVTKLKDKEIYAAMGWLAREGKVNIAEDDNDIMVSLIG
ncbi:MAG: winged helix-turn-helix domain-containing protein [Muribaculaceae bacterium]|nr:winged helix-turn-helix domain-containing protein [Muribaculaceae bacterium]